jgi:2-iminobutanoate/2-iminopropanoate deaminase
VSKSAVRTDKAPAPFQGAPYNQAIKSGGFVFVSGQGSLDAATGKIVEGDIRAQTQKTFDNLAAILEAAGSSLDRVVKTTVFMADLTQFAEMNAVYAERMGEPFPARSTIQAAALPGGIAVEIEAIAEAS